ncbi:hypothetical protein Syun_030153 [Stephania yunnanensis]|uniref:Pentatricopeptide repeat-containing protein n=1 Tax=Stephania yunnanensis TaxID=152371 RepID=A0AAP0EFA8_9MAGN
MRNRSTASWNSVIRGYFQNGEFEQGIELFEQMPHRDLFSYNIAITGLMRFGDVGNARRVFDAMPFKDVVSWNSMIAGYVRNCNVDEAVLFFDRMPQRSVVSWNLVMSGMVNVGLVGEAERMFREMPERDVASWTIMVDGLARSGWIVEARVLFEEMPAKDVRAWNTMLVGYIENNMIEIAEGLFLKMWERDLNSWNELIGGLASSERIYDAVRFFAEMPYKTSQCWNSVLLGLTKNGLVEEAHAIFEKSPFKDIVSWTNMVIGYFKLGEVGTAVKLFEMMPARDETAWNATIFGLSEHDHGEDGLKLFMRMKESGPYPDEATFTSVLTICSSLPSLEFGKEAHCQIVKIGLEDVVAVSNAIISMYARCGNMKSAFSVFSAMPRHDVISWNSVICGFAQHGNAVEALQMFRKMRLTGIGLNQITFVGVLSACSHAGLIEEGRYYFDFMRYKCFIRPTCEHYTCMVDLFGRFGFIEEAMSFINQMRADDVEPSTSVWGALLGACRIYKNIELGEMAAENILKIEPFNTGVYMILAEMYLDCGRREDSGRILVQMKKAAGAKKQPGCSWIEVNNSVHVFLAGDATHPEYSGVHSILNLLIMDMEIGLIRYQTVDRNAQHRVH